MNFKVGDIVTPNPNMIMPHEYSRTGIPGILLRVDKVSSNNRTFNCTIIGGPPAAQDFIKGRHSERQARYFILAITPKGNNIVN